MRSCLYRVSYCTSFASCAWTACGMSRWMRFDTRQSAFVLEGKSNPRVRSCGHAASFFMYAAKKRLRFHGCLKVPVSPPFPFTENLDQFARYMREEQGLSPYSIDSHCSKLRCSCAGSGTVNTWLVCGQPRQEH